MHRLILAALLLSPAAHAGTVVVSVNDTVAKASLEPGEENVHAFRVGRFAVRLVSLQERDEGGAWRWTLRLEREKDGTVEVLARPTLRTGPGLDGFLETDSRLGPVKVHVHD